MRTLLATAVCLTLASAALSDEVKWKGIPYAGVTVTGVDDCQIVYRIGTENTLKKFLGEVTQIEIDGQAAFNRAETLLADGDYKKAVTAYRLATTAAANSPKKWLGTLIRLRRLTAADKGGQIDTAVEDWLKVVQDNKASVFSLAMCPTKMAKKGSLENARAIRLLEAARDQTKNDKALKKIQGLLQELYNREGLEKKTAGGNAGGAGEEKTAPPSDNLQPLKALLDQGKAAEVVKEVTAKLNDYSIRELPTALYLLGKGQWLMAQKAQGDQRRTLLLDSGLNLMRVFVFFSSSPDAPESLYLAGRVNAALGNASAARRAYTNVKKLYPDSPFASAAGKALEAGQ